MYKIISYNVLFFSLYVGAAPHPFAYKECTHFAVLDKTYDHNSITVYKFLKEQKHSYIVFVEDENGKKYMVKQEKKPTLNKVFMAITEALCTYMAQSVGITANDVEIIPTDVSFPGKFITAGVATLHSFVEGTTIRDLESGHYARLNIKQGDHKDSCRKMGFCEVTIHWMSQHADLPSIVAFDTYMGNKDRNTANLIYDEATDRFTAIDMALTFGTLDDGRTVAQAALDNVKRMIREKVVFTEKELEALFVYSQTLKELIQNFPPTRVDILVDFFFAQSGIHPTESFTQKEIEVHVNKYKKLIRESYVVSKDLLYHLYLLTQQQKPEWLKRGNDHE